MSRAEGPAGPLEWRIERLEQERDRLARILAVERGSLQHVPDGWDLETRQEGDRIWQVSLQGAESDPTPYLWQVGIERPTLIEWTHTGWSRSRLEAMEAADECEP